MTREGALWAPWRLRQGLSHSEQREAVRCDGTSHPKGELGDEMQCAMYCNTVRKDPTKSFNHISIEFATGQYS